MLASSGTELDRWLDERHATPATRPTAEVLAAAGELGRPDTAKPRAITAALDELRAERL